MSDGGRGEHRVTQLNGSQFGFEDDLALHQNNVCEHFNLVFPLALAPPPPPSLSSLLLHQSSFRRRQGSSRIILQHLSE